MSQCSFMVHFPLLLQCINVMQSNLHHHYYHHYHPPQRHHRIVTIHRPPLHVFVRSYSTRTGTLTGALEPISHQRTFIVISRIHITLVICYYCIIINITTYPPLLRLINPSVDFVGCTYSPYQRFVTSIMTSAVPVASQTLAPLIDHEVMTAAVHMHASVCTR